MGKFVRQESVQIVWKSWGDTEYLPILTGVRGGRGGEGKGGGGKKKRWNKKEGKSGLPTQYFLQFTHLIRSIIESFTLAETNTKVN